MGIGPQWTASILTLRVDGVDAAYQRALDAGAPAAIPPTDTFFGDRYSQLVDPFGHVWALATAKEILTPEQIDERMRGLPLQPV